MTEQTKRDFFQLVVEKETTRCWSWIGEHDVDGRPVFRGEKAYRIMYQLRIDDVPERFHIHHKCENSACVNPRHLVALSAEAHRAVHATKDKTLKERIYGGEWHKIQKEKEIQEEGQRLARQRFEKQRLEQERIEEEAYQRRVASLAAQTERERKEFAAGLRKLQKLHLYITPALAFGLLLYCFIEFDWVSQMPLADLASWFSNPVYDLVVLALFAIMLVAFMLKMRRKEVRGAFVSRLRKLHLYGIPALVCGLLWYLGWQFDWFLNGTSQLAQIVLCALVLIFSMLAIRK